MPLLFWLYTLRAEVIIPLGAETLTWFLSSTVYCLRVNSTTHVRMLNELWLIGVEFAVAESIVKDLYQYKLCFMWWKICKWNYFLFYNSSFCSNYLISEAIFFIFNVFFVFVWQHWYILLFLLLCFSIHSTYNWNNIIITHLMTITIYNNIILYTIILYK